jgi:hypothetical protein
MSHAIDLVSLVARIKAEYREMPGLQLTERQMQRMWGLDRPTWEVVIGTLVSQRIIVKTCRDVYARADHPGTTIQAA